MDKNDLGLSRFPKAKLRKTCWHNSCLLPFACEHVGRHLAQCMFVWGSNTRPGQCAVGGKLREATELHMCFARCLLAAATLPTEALAEIYRSLSSHAYKATQFELFVNMGTQKRTLCQPVRALNHYVQTESENIHALASKQCDCDYTGVTRLLLWHSLKFNGRIHAWRINMDNASAILRHLRTPRPFWLCLSCWHTCGVCGCSSLMNSP